MTIVKKKPGLDFNDRRLSSDNFQLPVIETDPVDFVGRKAVPGSGKSDKLNGTNGSDTIDGKAGNDTIKGLGGNDILIGGAGNDTVSGGNGNDVITDVSGKNRLSGDAGNDRITGGKDADRVEGGSGNDIVKGLGGNDILIGGAGNDTVSGGNGNDVITDVSGKNRLSGDAGNDRITGGKDADRVEGGSGNDIVKGMGGNDTLIGGSGKNTLSGGSGFDTAVFEGRVADYEMSYDAKGQLTVFKSGSQAVLDRTVEIIKFDNDVIDLRHPNTPVIRSATIDTALVITGTSDPYARIVVKDGTVRIGVTVADADGNWSFDHAGVFDRDQSFTATASYGNHMPSATSPAATFDPAENFFMFTLSPSQGFIVKGSAPEQLAGWSVSSAGDVNGDGIDDFIISAPGVDNADDVAKKDHSGEAYVIFGTASGFGTNVSGRQFIDLSTLTPSQGVVIRPAAIGDQIGNSVSSAGDVNGDGFDDFIVGAYVGDGSGSLATGAYVIFGTASSFGSVVGGRNVIDLATLSADKGFLIKGDDGARATTAGDVNGDGFDDLIIGAVGGDDGGVDAGESYVIFGTASGVGTVVGGHRVIDLTTLAAGQGFIIQGDAAGDATGNSVASAGDVNGDGFEDLIVGAPQGDDGGNNAGEAYVIFGTASGFGSDVGGRQVIDLKHLSAGQGFIIQGDETKDVLGTSVSSAGDVNGDGFDDLIVGAPGHAEDYVREGDAYVIFGQASGFGSDVSGRRVIDVTTLTPEQGFILRSYEINDYAGVSVSSAGDINGDGYDDLIVGGLGSNNYAVGGGQSYVIFGAATGIGSEEGGRQVLNFYDLLASQGFKIDGEYDDSAGFSVSSAGDINDDGFDDLIVGAPLGEPLDPKIDNAGTGRAYILYGGTFSSSTKSVNLVGSSAAEIMIGDAGNDTLRGNGGADIYRSGAGNDRIMISNAGFRMIDMGGGDQDVVVFAGKGFKLDARDFSNSQLTGIEGFNLRTGNNTLMLDAADVFQFSNTGNGRFTGADSHNNNLVIDGNSGDTLQLFDNGAVNAEWMSAEVNSKLDGTAGGDYTFVNLIEDGTHRVLASIAVDQDVTLVL